MGFSFAIEELPLVFFTTLAPVGAVSLIALSIMVALGIFKPKTARRICQLKWIPLVLATLGLILSAAHLGTPANALYVFAGIGRSPLSNEVICTVVFLAFCGVDWLLSFAEKSHKLAARILALCIVVSGVVFLYSIMFAYNVKTITTWSSVYVPLNLLLGAIVGGLILTQLVLMIAMQGDVSGKVFKVLAVVTIVAFVLHCIFLVLQCASLGNVRNIYYGSVANLVYVYPFAIAFYILVFVCVAAISKKTFDCSYKKKLAFRIVMCALILLAIFFLRFCFYMMHTTVGLA